MTTSENKGADVYAARFDVDHPSELDRFTTFFRIIWIIPIAIIWVVLSATGTYTYVTDTGEVFTESTGGIAGALVFATALLIVFR